MGFLAPHLAGVLDSRREDRARTRLRGVLALDDADLVRAVAGGAEVEAMRFLEDFDADAARARLEDRVISAVCRHAPGYPSSLSALTDSPGHPVLHRRS